MWLASNCTAHVKKITGLFRPTLHAHDTKSRSHQPAKGSTGSASSKFSSSMIPCLGHGRAKGAESEETQPQESTPKEKESGTILHEEVKGITLGTQSTSRIRLNRLHSGVHFPWLQGGKPGRLTIHREHMPVQRRAMSEIKLYGEQRATRGD